MRFPIALALLAVFAISMTFAVTERPSSDFQFDIAKPATMLFGTYFLPFAQSRIQSFSFVNERSKLYIAALQYGVDEMLGNLVISEFNLNGKLTGWMILKGFGHGVSIGAHYYGGSTYIWTGCSNDKTTGRSHALCRVRFVHKSTLTSSSSLLKKVTFGATTTYNYVASVDAYHGILGIRHSGPGGNLRLYDLASAMKPTPAFVELAPKKSVATTSTGVAQGFYHFGRFLYTTGSEKGATTITKIDMANPNIQQLSRSSAGQSFPHPEGQGGGVYIPAGKSISSARFVFAMDSRATGSHVRRVRFYSKPVQV